MAGGYIYINGTYVTDIVMDTFTVTNTGLLSSGYVTPVWTYSGSGTFLGFSTTSGATTPDSNYVIGSTFTPTSTLYLYSVEATVSNETYITSDIDLASVANAIRAKGGTSASLVYPAGYISAINALPTGTLQSYKSAVFTTPGSATLTPDSGYVGIEEISVEYSPAIYDGAYHTVVYPVKGDIINIDMNGDNVSEQYLVLSINNKVAEVLSRTDYTSCVFAASGQIYSGSTLDTTLNTTYYNTLSEVAKAAIVDKSFQPDSWYNSSAGNPDYTGYYGSTWTYTLSLGSASFGSLITRHIYALSIQDILDYIECVPSMNLSNTTLKMVNVQNMYNITSGYVWTRSALASNSGQVLDVVGQYGAMDGYPVNNAQGARPAFQIDLSKIDWSFAS